MDYEADLAGEKGNHVPHRSYDKERRDALRDEFLEAIAKASLDPMSRVMHIKVDETADALVAVLGAMLGPTAKDRAARRAIARSFAERLEAQMKGALEASSHGTVPIVVLDGSNVH